MYALRTMARQPGFTAVVALSIALGIAANTTVFSIANATLFGALPVRDPGNLFVFTGSEETVSYPDFRDYRDQCSGVFSEMAAHFPFAPANLAGSRTPERVWGQLVSGNYFPLLGVPMALGRGISPQDDGALGQSPIVVLSHGIWVRRFAADAAILGKPVVMNGRQYTVVGVAAAGFRGADRGILPQFWAPLSMYPDFIPDMAKDVEKRSTSWLETTARLRPGVTREQAVASVNVVHKRLLPPGTTGRQAEPVSLDAAGGIPLLGAFAARLVALLMGTVSLVLLIACANAANLLLARAVERRHEIGIRLAIGAGRGRLIRQLLVESTALAFLGAAGGLALTFLATRALSTFQLPVPIPITFDFTPDLRVLAFTVAVALATGILFGLLPALAATRKAVSAALSSGQSRTGTSRRLGPAKLLVGVQVTLSVVLLVGAGLFLRSLQRAASLDLGIHPENILILTVDTKTGGYSEARSRDFLRQLDERVTALPGVRSVAAVNLLPLSLAQNNNRFYDPSDPSVTATSADIYHVTGRYFETIGIQLVRGRDFRPDRDLDRGALLVNRTMARRLFGERDPIGRQISMSHSGSDRRYEIIGLVGDSKSVTFGEDVRPCAYAYLPRDPEEVISLLGLTLLVKTAGNPSGMLGPVRAQIEAIDPNLAVFNVNTMESHVANAFFLPRVCATLFGTFGVVGLLLAVVGLFGLVSYSVRSRTREIGIRMALGAEPSAVLGLVLRQGLTIVLISLAIGVAIAFAVGRLAANLLYGISATDPLTFLLVPLVLLAAARAAVMVPARRAMRLDPVNTLRAE